jgi:DNA-binding beta-propeller fold protein YncE
MTTTKSTKLASFGRSTAVKTFTRNNNKSVEPGNIRQAITQRIATQLSCVAYLKVPLFLLCTLATLGFATTSPALAAAEPHPKIGEFGSFSNPNGIAIDEASGDVYVADIGTNTVYKFDASGKPVNFASLGSNALTHSFSFPSVYGSPAAIAVDNACVQHTPALTGKACEEFDPSAGDLYVMDGGHGVIDKFSPSGEYLSQIGFPPVTFNTGVAEGELLGLGVDGSGTVHVDLSTNAGRALIEEFDDAAVNHLIARQQWVPQNNSPGIGVPVGEERPAHGFAVSATGDRYPIYEPSCSCTVKFGQKLSPLGSVDSREAGDVAVAVDPATGHLYADDQSSVAEWDTGAMNRSSSAESNNQSAGTLVARFGSFELSGTSGHGGIAVDGRTGEIYVSNPGEGNPGEGNPGEGKVYVFGSDAPAVTVGEPADVTKEAASLSGTVDPRGVAVSACKFEYGLTDALGTNEKGNGPYDHSVSCKQTPAEIEAGSSPVAVSAQLEGLVPGELYHFRLVVSNANGPGQDSGLLATQGVGFGIKSFEINFLNEDGTPDTQAGSHPYQFVDTFELNSRFKRQESNADSPYLRVPDGVLRDVTVDLPPGLVGDPNAPPKKCTGAELVTIHSNGEGLCSPESRVGELFLSWSHVQQRIPGFEQTVFAMVPPRGVALQLGTNFGLPLLYINNGVAAGGDYPVQATVTAAAAQAPVIRSTLVISGVLVPCVRVQLGSGKYNNSFCRGLAGPGGENDYETEPPSHGKAFLTLPTGCHGPLRATMAADSWAEPGQWVKASTVTHNSAGTPVALTGCSKLKFPPEIGVAPDSSDASTSSGLTVNVHVPQTAAFNPTGLAESSLRDTTVTLPEGVALNPAGADGLEACSSDAGVLPEGALGSPGDQIGYKGQQELNAEYEPGVKWSTFTPELASPLAPGSNFCANGSKIGTVKIKTPLLEHELEGAVYLAAQNNNPFGSLVAMYIVAEDPYSGSLIKLAGEVSLNPQTGQISTTFKNTPDLPFENLELHFYGGERAPLATPARCGTYTTKAVFTPWDGNGPVTSESSFNIEHGPHGGPCPGASLPFSPSLDALMADPKAGAFSPLSTTFSREDGQQDLQAIQFKMPPGLSGLLSGVELCPEPQASQGTCGAGSLIGETIVSVGVGGSPFSVKGGKVYITGPYRGAPFGLSIVNPAKAGPFDLEAGTPCDCVLVRAKIEVDPITAALTITTDNTGPFKIPTILKGIPLQIQHVNVTINGVGGNNKFTFNPTNCGSLAVTGTISSAQGASVPVSDHFEVTNCAKLAFKPGFKVSTSGKTSRSKGASLSVKLTYPKAPFGSQANIKSVKVDLPKQLPSRLTTLQKACTAAQFNTNPAGCPAASVVGHAKAITPLIPVPLEGPAYFVSHGGEAFPSLIVVLQGYGVTLDLVGTTFISKAGITSTTFKTVPDAPVGSFELTLPQGKFSALGTNKNLCALTKTVTVKKTVLRKVHGHTRKVVKKTKKTVVEPLQMPTEFVAQNGAKINQSTPVTVTGCPKAHKAKKAKKQAKHKTGGKGKKGKKR